MEHSELPPSLLDRSLTGECSFDDTNHIRERLQASQDAARDFALLREIRDVASRTPVWDVERGWSRMRREFREADMQSERRPQEMTSEASNVQASRVTKPISQSQQVTRHRPVVFSFVVGVCAVLFVAAGMLLPTPSATTLPSASPEVVSYTTSSGEQSTISLPDGSTVKLNVASQLQLPADFSKGNRTVTLSGEAMFDVANQQDAPFVVISGPSVTRVLGTRFVVRHYETDSIATIAVQDGKVVVGRDVLSASQEIVVGNDGASAVRMASASRFSFVRGYLTLEGMSLGAAIPELNRWYNADIKIADSSLSTQRIKGELQFGSLDDLSAILTMMFDLRVVRDGRTLTLYQQ